MQLFLECLATAIILYDPNILTCIWNLIYIYHTSTRVQVKSDLCRTKIIFATEHQCQLCPKVIIKYRSEIMNFLWLIKTYQSKTSIYRIKMQQNVFTFHSFSITIVLKRLKHINQPSYTYINVRNKESHLITLLKKKKINSMYS